MNTIMSTSIIPDIYRHTARKSTVSRNVKSQVKTVASLPVTNTCKEEPSIFETIQCDIKLESDSLPMEQSFVIIPDNEIEQMVVEQTNDEIIRQIIEQIQNQIQNDVLIQLMDVNPNCTSISMDIHHTIDAMMDRLEENMCDRNIDTTNNESIVTVNEVHTRNVTSSINEDASMESEQRSSMLSRSHMNDDDDIVEIENVSRSDPHPPLCTCQCHQNAPNSTADYLLFEQALRQTRQEQQKERSLNNNRLIQTLKRQHQELMTFYQRQLYINKIDREQQTMQINHNDTQIQTDISTMQPPVSKSNNLQANGKHSTPNTKPPPPVPVRPFNSFLTPIRTKGPSLQQLIPCLTTTTTSTTTTVTNKISMIKKPATVPVVPQDIVDLTEEDDDDNNNNKNRSLTSSRPQQNPVTNTTPATTTTTSLQATTRSNPSTPIGQMFPLRPLPEQTSVDSKIARPQLSITQDNTIVRLTWNLPSTPMEWIQNYEIYAYKYTAIASTTDWKKIGTVKSMRLPMAVTLKEFQPNSHYAFAVRGVSTTNQMGPFCEPKTIFTGTTTTTPNSSQILNGSS